MGEHVLEPEEVRLAGANNWMMLYSGEKLVGHASHWRVDWSDLGPGQALFTWSGEGAEVTALVSDNVELATWILSELVAEDSPARRSGAAVSEAVITVSNDTPGGFAVLAKGGGREIEARWLELIEPVWGRTSWDPGDTHSHSACYVPARNARLSVDGAVVNGSARAEDWYGTPSSSAFLALAEVWLRRKS